MTNAEIYQWLDSLKLQKEYDEQHHALIYESDIPKIIEAFFLQKIYIKEKSGNYRFITNKYADIITDKCDKENISLSNRQWEIIADTMELMYSETKKHQCRCNSDWKIGSTKKWCCNVCGLPEKDSFK